MKIKKLFIRLVSLFILNKGRRKAFRSRHLDFAKGDDKSEDPNAALNLRLDKIERALLYSMPPARGKLRELQQNAYRLLCFLKEICEKHQLTFWIQGGTLLGAARHQGFIPWDDDVDCGMSRADLEKLKNILRDNPEVEYIECYNIALYKSFACKMPKIHFRNNNSVFVDIFPYDYISISDEKKEWKSFIARRRELTAALVDHNYNSADCPVEDAEMLGKLEESVRKFLPSQIERQNATHIIWGIENLPSRFMRLYKIDDFFPNMNLLFEDKLFPVPKDYNAYLKRQYKNIWLLPKDVGNMRHFNHSINHRKQQEPSSEVVGYTAGAFDLFHIGHLNLLKNARSKCSRLIVGVTTDELIKKTKGKRPFIPLSERMDIVRSCKYVDDVVVQDDLDKFEAWKLYQFNILFSGSDWQSSPRWQQYEQRLNEVGVKVFYFPYTKSTSSSMIQKVIKDSDSTEI